MVKHKPSDPDDVTTPQPRSTRDQSEVTPSRRFAQAVRHPTPTSFPAPVRSELVIPTPSKVASGVRSATRGTRSGASELGRPRPLASLLDDDENLPTAVDETVVAPVDVWPDDPSPHDDMPTAEKRVDVVAAFRSVTPDAYDDDEPTCALPSPAVSEPTTLYAREIDTQPPPPMPDASVPELLAAPPSDDPLNPRYVPPPPSGPQAIALSRPPTPSTSSRPSGPMHNGRPVSASFPIHSPPSFPAAPAPTHTEGGTLIQPAPPRTTANEAWVRPPQPFRSLPSGDRHAPTVMMSALSGPSNAWIPIVIALGVAAIVMAAIAAWLALH